MENPYQKLFEVLEQINTKLDQQINKPKEDLSGKRYTIKEASAILNVIPLTIRNHIKNGNLKADKFGRKYLILHSELFNSLDEVKSLKYKR